MLVQKRISALIFVATASTCLSLSKPVWAQCVEGCRVIHTFTGEGIGDNFGWVSNPIGDIDGNGVEDFATTAYTYGAANVGRLYMYSGLDGSLALPVVTGTIPNELLGFSAASAGDVDDDGVPDILSGAPGNSAGRVYIYSGANGALLRTYVGEALADTFGVSATGLGDINGDGHSDVLVGAPQRAAPGVQQGRVYVYSGLDSSLLCQANGEAANHRFGEGVAKVEDIHGDGIPDFVVGAKDAGPSSNGRAYVFSGADCVGGATIFPVLTLQPTGASFDFGLFFMDSGDANGDGTPDIYVSDFTVSRAHIFSGVDGSLLRTLVGTSGAGFGIGRFVGDVNGDACDDLILASWIDNTGGTQAGKAEVFSGRDGRMLERYTHNVPFAQFGFDAHGMRDVDGDGMTDYVVTAANDSNATGKAYVLAGNVAPVPSTPRCLVVGWASANVQAFDITNGDFVNTLVASGSGGLTNAHSVVVGPDRLLYVTSAGSNRILRYHPETGAFIGSFVNPVGTPLNTPMDAIFGPDGHLYVASFNSGHVLRFHGITGAYLGIFATGPGVLGQVEMLAFGPDGHLYVANGERNSVTRYDGATGAPLPGPMGAPGTADFVLPDSGGLDDPHSLEFGPDGNLYVASFDTNTVLRFDGTTGAFMDTFVTAGSGGLVSPHGSTFGPDGDLFVGSAGTNQVLRYDGTTGDFKEVFIQSGTGLINPVQINFMRHPADLDNDFDVDSADALLFSACISGRGIPLTPGCEAADFDRDGDVDCGDGANFNRGWTGAPAAAPMFSCPESCVAEPCVSPEPATASAPHDRLKNRYISFAPNGGGIPAAIRVEKLTAPTGTCWVAAPDGTGESRCVAAPVYRVWTESVVHVADCEIVPVANYEVSATPDGIVFTTPLSVDTIMLPALNSKLWGDVAGMNNGMEWTPPNLFTNVNDILAVLAYINNAPVKPEFQRANLQSISSGDPCLNAFINTADVFILVKAVAGDAYPFTTNPATCPVCP